MCVCSEIIEFEDEIEVDDDSADDGAVAATPMATVAPSPAKPKTKPDFRLMDAHKLDFPENTFDVVYGAGILRHLDYARALLEILRVLRPGGAMIF